MLMYCLGIGSIFGTEASGTIPASNDSSRPAIPPLRKRENNGSSVIACELAKKPPLAFLRKANLLGESGTKPEALRSGKSLLNNGNRLLSSIKLITCGDVC
jgi:hypothetical protein